ncbi:MAG: bile acid:sodium symporter [Solirubrobacteraceae bacterium]|nr:bile acid:sodium symporter [Solirubrobacteraceae bacterium]
MEPSPVATALLSVALAVIMFALGTTLRGEQFRLVLTKPRGIVVGLVNLVIVAPLLAFGIAELTGLDPILAAGLVLLGAAPGGTFANLLTHAAGGATALSVSMTAISSTLAVITVPFWLGVSLDAFGVDEAGVDLDMPLVVVRVMATIAIPIALGMLLAARRTDWVTAHQRDLERIAFGTFVVVVLVAVLSQTGPVLDNLGSVAPAALLLNITAMSIGYGASRLAKLDAPQSTAIAIELGVHNAALAIAIGAAVDERLAIPAAVYSSFMVVTAGAFAWFMHRRMAAEQATTAAA